MYMFAVRRNVSYMVAMTFRFPENTFMIETTQVTEMLERNITAPFRFIKVGGACTLQLNTDRLLF